MEIDECGNLFFPTLISCVDDERRSSDIPTNGLWLSVWREREKSSSRAASHFHRCHPKKLSPLRLEKCFIVGSFSSRLIKKKYQMTRFSVSSHRAAGWCCVRGCRSSQPPTTWWHSTELFMRKMRMEEISHIFNLIKNFREMRREEKTNNLMMISFAHKSIDTTAAASTHHLGGKKCYMSSSILMN